ncbi:hypothetical protein B7494_g3641 [Chlorociboria aeruginascens]|nr:hypothetical protein B7494_g3641 [Chlorociboria aeruginascens]
MKVSGKVVEDMFSKFKLAKPTAVFEIMPGMIQIEEEHVTGMEAWLRIFHETNNAQMSKLSIGEVWNTICVGRRYSLDLKKAESWLASWLGRNGGARNLGKFNVEELRQIIFPCHEFDHAEGFATATRRVICEKNPTEHIDLHLEQRIIYCLNNLADNDRKYRVHRVRHENYDSKYRIAYDEPTYYFSCIGRRQQLSAFEKEKQGQQNGQESRKRKREDWNWTNDSPGWRLDIVSLLAVIGESSMESHSQAMTASWTCILPRIIPAPQALLKASRPTRMPEVNAAVIGVHNGTMFPTLNYFPNIIHPIELPPFTFRVYHIRHNYKKRLTLALPGKEKEQDASESTSRQIDDPESGQRNSGLRRRPVFNRNAHSSTSPDKPKPRVPVRPFSPLNVLSVLSCCLTVGLFIWAVLIKDGTACLALATISLASSIVGYASWWTPALTVRNFQSRVPGGDVVIRTREGAFIVVKCNEEVARELYTGTEECIYYVKTEHYRILVGIGTFLLMISVVLLGNCGFTMQAAVGSSYIVLNGAFWATSLLNKRLFWDLSNYEWEDITPADAQDAHKKQDETVEGKPSFTRTMWYAIRETEKIQWVKRNGAAPRTPQWDRWLQLAEENAEKKNRDWNAVQQREDIVGEVDVVPHMKQSDHSETIVQAVQHVPTFVVPPPAKR